MAAKASQTTVLRFGAVKAPVSLYKTTGEVKEAQFETAGPSGGALEHEYRVIEGEAPAGFDPITGQVIDAEVIEEDSSAFLPHISLADFSEGAPVTERVLVEKGTGTIVSEPRRGIRDAEGAFIDLTDQLKAIDETVKLDEMRVVAFVDVGQIDRSRIIGSYYLKPDDGAGRALDVLYTGLRRNRRVAVVRWGKRVNQAVGVVTAYQGGLTVLELAFAPEVRKRPPGYGREVVEGDLAQAGDRLVTALTGRLPDLNAVTDDRAELRARLRRAAEAGYVEAFEAPVQDDTAAERDLAEALG